VNWLKGDAELNISIQAKKGKRIDSNPDEFEDTHTASMQKQIRLIDKSTTTSVKKTPREKMLHRFKCTVVSCFEL